MRQEVKPRELAEKILHYMVTAEWTDICECELCVKDLTEFLSTAPAAPAPAPPAALTEAQVALKKWEEDTGTPASCSEGNAFIDGFYAGVRGAVPSPEPPPPTKLPELDPTICKVCKMPRSDTVFVAEASVEAPKEGQ
jgi:hypothetical protein